MEKQIIEILKQEINNNFKNNSVFGGLSFFVKKLSKNDKIDHPIIKQLLDYDYLNIDNRKKLVYQILDYLQNKNKEYEKKDNQTLNEENLENFENLIIDTDNSILNAPINYFAKDLNLNKRILNNLKKIGIESIGDLLWFVPRSYSDRTKSVSLKDAINQEKAFLNVEIISNYQIIKPNNKKLKIIKYMIKDEYGNIGEIVFFNQEYITHLLNKGKRIRVFGRVIKNRVFQVMPEEWEFDELKTIDFNRIVPTYSTSINPKKIREIIFRALKLVYKKINDPLINLLNKILSNFEFDDLSKAFVNIHFPPNYESLQRARNRLALEEIIYTQILMNGISKKKETIYIIDKEKALELFSKLELPFELTNAQKRVINEIIEDLSSKYSCRRLIQGDVGAGKTVVAMVACFVVCKHGYQAALMAPTEILATQHYNNFKNILPNLQIELLTSKIKGKKREQIFEKLKEGKIDILIGTHALINEDVEFKDLALIIVDEQHKFGVQQRFKLYSKSQCPHLVVMSATPIPRTLALTVYSDLDISIIDELPPGRKKAITEIFNYKDIKKVYDFIKKQLKEGRQAYVICPSIFENPKLELKNVEKIYKEIKEYFAEYKVDYLHGKMNNKEKDKVMEDFRNKNIDILISTTVVEVGVDVPNANTILILDAERFGLSQLHQLRGRVKRSNHQPYCLLVTSKNLSYQEFSKSLQRLNVLKYYDDGFKIAEKDLELRGPGEVIGYKQHGFTDFKVLNPLKDVELIKFSNKLAQMITPQILNFNFIKQKIQQINQKMQDITDSI